ncbi:MAG: PAS domain-containing protein, partial [Planctomycetota bacterium]
QQVKAAYGALYGHNVQFDIEYRIKRKDGQWIWLHDRSIATYEDGGVRCADGIFSDVTARKEAENAVREAEEKWRSLAETAPSFIITVGHDGTIQFLNRTTGGLTQEQAIGTTVYEHVDPGHCEIMRKCIEKVFETGEPDSYEIQGLGPDGQNSAWYESHLGPIVRDGKVVAVNMVSTDVTKSRKAAEEARRFQTIADRAGHGVATSDPEGNLTYVNESFARMHGYGQDELVGRHLSILHNQDQMERVSQLNRQLVQEGSYVAEEVWHRRSDNTVFPSLMSATVIRDEEGVPLFLACTAVDISERKKAEDALRESEETFRLAMETTNDALWDWNMVTNEVYRNPRHATMLGYEPDELSASQEEWEKRIHPDDKPSVFEAAKEHLDGKTPSFKVEYRLRAKSGDYVWILGRGKVVAYSDDGSPLRMIGTNIDITEKKKAETELRDSRNLLEKIFYGLDSAIFVLDYEKPPHIIDCNSAALSMFGYTKSQMLGQTTDFLHVTKDTLLEFQRTLFPAVEEQGHLSSFEFRMKRKNGEIFPTEHAVFPLQNDDGDRIGWVSVVRDITERRKAVGQIRTLSSAVEQSIDGIAIADLEPKLLYVNDAYARLHGYTRQEMEGMNLVGLCFNESASECKRAIQQIQTQGSWTGEVEHVRKDGTVFPAYVSITLLKDDDGEPAGTLALCRDMTEAKQKEEELTKYRTQMARAEQLASLGTLSATVAHQITQPLTVIQLSLDNALDELEGASYHKVVRGLRDSVTQISNITTIINRFRNFARQSSDTRFGQVSVSEIAVRVVRLLHENARQARVALRLKGMGTLPAVSMNETDLEQLFFALLENAIQAADGTQTRQVVISGALKQEQIELRFSDTCGGIAPENRGRVFEPFFTTKPRGQGTGLGLCIVQDVVTRVGGRIRLESEPGKGTTFFVTLPVDKDATS